MKSTKTITASGLASRAALFAVTTGWLAVGHTHHSFAPFEDDVQIVLEGTVTSFQWTNPHIYIELDVADENQAVKNWLIECANTTILNRVGWKWNMVKEGDQVALIVAPLRNGEPAALLKRVRLADGSEYGNGGPAGPAIIDFDGNPLASAVEQE